MICFYSAFGANARVSATDNGHPAGIDLGSIKCYKPPVHVSPIHYEFHEHETYG
jgi:hypothetical protein